MEMRLRLPELLAEHQTTAYAIAQKSNGRIDESTLYRLTRKGGNVRYLDTELLEALFSVLGLERLDQLLEVGRGKPSAARVAGKGKRGRG